MKSTNYVFLLLALLLSFNVFSQSAPTVITNSPSIGFPNANLKDGKIILRNDNLSEAINNVQVSVARYAGTESVSINIEAYFVLDNGTEVAISPVLTFNNGDFSPNYSVASVFKYINLTIPANTNKQGSVKLKMREKKNGIWSSYLYANKVYNVHLLSGNDEYTTATVLTPGEAKIAGSTNSATVSSQSRPSCYNPAHYAMTKDVWYKFTALSPIHTINITNEKFSGYASGTHFVALALYDSSLQLLNCFSNNTATFNNLNVGQTYYVRLWAASGNADMLVDFNISLSTNGSNAIIGLSSNGYIFTVDYVHDSSIPLSDIKFEWGVSPGHLSTPNYWTNPYVKSDTYMFSEPEDPDEDVTVRLRVRMMRESTNEVLVDWFYYSRLIWL